MQIAAELTLLSRAFHGPSNAAVHRKGTHVDPAAFCNEFLNDHTGLQTVEGLANGHRGLLIVGEYNAQTLGTFQKLGDAWSATHAVHDAAYILAVIGKNRSSVCPHHFGL